MNQVINPEKKNKKRILLVEDEAHLAFTLDFNLQQEGFETTPAVNGTVAIEKFESMGPFDVIILDVNLPEQNGFEVLKHIRSKDQSTGILMLTARAADADRLNGFKMGADDYITKPFHLEELLMRVKRMADRSDLIKNNHQEDSAPTEEGSKTVLVAGCFKLDTDSLTLYTPETEHQLTALESDLLAEFIRNEKKVLSREYLLKNVWGVTGTIETRTVDNFVARLRRYLETDPATPVFLTSVRSRGYRFHPTGDKH